MTTKKATVETIGKCGKCADLEARIAALELARRAFDNWASAHGHHPLSIFEDAIRDEDARA